MSSDDVTQLRFNELRQRAKSGALGPDERAEYEEVKERFARAICAAQNIRLKPGQRARSSFRVAALFKVEVTLDGPVQKAATMDVSMGGFSSLLGASAPLGTEVSFKLYLSTKEGISGRAVVASAEKERSGGSLYRVSFAFSKLEAAEASRLEETLFDAVLLRKLTSPAMLLPPPRPTGGGPAEPPRPSTTSAVAVPTPATAIRPASAASRAAPSSTSPIVVAAKPREQMRSVDRLLDEAVGEMHGASEAARREEMQPGGGVTPPAAERDDETSAAPRATPTSLVALEARATPARPAPSVRGRSRSRATIAGAAVTACIVATIFVWRASHTPRGATRASAAPAPNAGPFVPPAADPESSPPRPSPPPTLDGGSPPTGPRAAAIPTLGGVRVTVAGRRVFIDGRLAGEGPRTFPLPCGKHKLQVGSAGAARVVDVPCGAEIVIGKQ